jgi:ribosome biogenesis GTPase
MLVGIVLSRTGGRYRVFTAPGRTVEATLRGRMKYRGGEQVLVGDQVGLALHGAEAATIERVEQRRSVVRRRSPGRGRGIRPVAANVDQVVVVGSTCEPDWNPYLMDRFAAVAAANHLPAIIVVNKADLDCDGAAAALGDAYQAAGYVVLVTSAKTGFGLAELHRQLTGRASLLTGPTGVGKSSLLNAMLPGLTLRTREVSPRSGTGRHTTVAAEMHPLGAGGFVVDTPGLRDVGLWGLTAPEVGAAFPEFTPYRDGCRFDNCRHRDEPGCAVTDAVERGALVRTRYESYLRLLAETELAARPWA